MALLVEESSRGIGGECGDTMKTPPNQIGRANRRPAFAFDAGRQFESAFLPAAVAHLDR
jgi:hypothetical protein